MRSKASNSAFLTTEEVLDCLKVNPRTIYRLIKTGELPAVRIGRQWRFRRADLDEWIERQQTAAS
jgi:excisionase family DNA binding protein